MAGDDLTELMEWEKKKTDEVYVYNKLCEGIRPDLKRFRRAVDKFTECAWKYKLGSGPFTYGERKDYWAEITARYYNNYDKRPYFGERKVEWERKLLLRQQE